MAIGDTLRPELLRSNTSGILQGGLAAGRSAERGLSEFGAAIGTAWKDHNEKKQKKRDEAEVTQAIQRFDPSLSSEDAAALAKHSAVRDFRDRLAAEEERDQAMEYRDLQMQAMEDTARLRKEQEAGQRQFLDRITAPTDTEETRELQEGFDAFHQNVYPKVMSWVERFSGRGMSPEDEAQWREDHAIREEARLAPTRGPSLVEDPSPKAFLGIAGDLANPYAQQAALDAAAGLETVERSQRLAKETREAELRDKMLFEQFKHDLEKGEKTEVDQMGSMVVNDAIGRADELLSGWTTGYGSYLKALPESDARSVAALFETIKANIGFDKLHAMREASPTGGALGQVSERELTALQAVFGNLDQAQKEEELMYNMKLLQHVYNNIIHGMGKHPYPHPDGSTTPLPSSDEEEKRRLLEVYDKEGGGGENVNTPVPVPAAPQGLWQRRRTVWDNTFGQPVSPLL